MTFEAQFAERKDSGNIKDLTISESNHVPSWKRPGEVNGGYANFRAYGCEKWLTLITLEGYRDSRKGKGSASRETMMTLNRGAAIALRDLLNELYPAE